MKKLEQVFETPSATNDEISRWSQLVCVAMHTTRGCKWNERWM
jgi:hypothetical protein